MNLNISQKQQEEIKAGNSKTLKEVLESKLKLEIGILINTTRTSEADNQSKGICQSLDVIIKLLP